jgi:acyl transferase domain-containing protein/surfactin synthase thioesterase subunit
MTDLSPVKQALLTIKKLKLALARQKAPEAVAIIGLSCRFPSASNKMAFWQLMKQSQNAISPLSKARLALLKGTPEYDLYHAEHPYWGGYLSEIEKFDPYFFGISPREAILMDPQQRLLLEVAYEGLEDAGITLEKLAGSNTGVFVAMYGSEFLKLQNLDNDLDALYIPTGNASSIAANRLSYQFNLHGPSITLDSACSSSLVAIHLACQSLQTKESELAIVAASKLNLLPSINDILSRATMLSVDGQCKTFDAEANGYVQGEGVAVVILKPLEKALLDNDRIYGVIASSTVNQDGKTNGLTAPSGTQQEALLKKAYTLANIDPSLVNYVECHGTGTVLGDPIEVEALENVLGKAHINKDKPCWIGSVKTNIGHLEPAAGLAGIIKVALGLQAMKIPPHLNFVEPNPHIPFDHYHLQIPLKTMDWPCYGEYRVAGVSSFGFGGTNAHVVIRELNPQELASRQEVTQQQPAELFTLSAKNAEALNQLVKAWVEHLARFPEVTLDNWCYQLHTRRTHHAHRLALIVTTLEDLLQQLKSFVPSDAVSIKKGAKKSIMSTEISEGKNLELLAQHYKNGDAIDWDKIESFRRYLPIDLPLYPWQHKSYWPDFTVTKLVSDKPNPLHGQKLTSPLKNIIQFEFHIDANTLPELVHTHNALHIGFYMEMLALASQEISGQLTFEVQDLHFLNLIYIPQDVIVRLQLVLLKRETAGYDFKIYKYSEKTRDWAEHTFGIFIADAGDKPKLKSRQEFQKQLLNIGSSDDFANRIKAMGMPVGESIRWTAQYWRNEKAIISKFHEPEENKKANQFNLKIHPGIFDACIQPLFILLDENVTNSYLATKIASIKYFGPTANNDLYLLADLTPSDTEKYLYGSWRLVDSQDQVVAVCEGLQLTQLGTATLDQVAEKFKPSDAIVALSGMGEDRQHKMIQMVRELVAHIFKMPLEDVDVDEMLQDLGMDSLMAAALSKQIEETLQQPFALQELFQPITISQIAEKLLEHAPEMTTPIITMDKTLPSYVTYRQKRPNAKMRLFCFPYGGAGASIYRSWSSFFPDSIEICPVQYPGRETLFSVQAPTDIKDLIPDLYKHLASEMDLPFAFSGHSFGSLVAFEMARYARKYQLKQPVHLFASVFPAPQLPNPPNFKGLMQKLKALPYDVWHTDVKQLSDDQLKETFTLITGNMDVDKNLLFSIELMRLLLPAFLTDARLVESYQYYAEPALDIPLSVFFSNTDAWVPEKVVEPWSIHTNKKFDIHGIDGGHLFINDDDGREEILNIIQNILKQRGDL